MIYDQNTSPQQPVVMVNCPSQLIRGKEHTILNVTLPIVENGQSLRLDMSHVKAIDAAGIGALMMMRHYAEHSGGTFEIVAPSPRVLEVLRLTQLDSVLLASHVLHDSNQLAAA